MINFRSLQRMSNRSKNGTLNTGSQDLSIIYINVDFIQVNIFYNKLTILKIHGAQI